MASEPNEENKPDNESASESNSENIIETNTQPATEASLIVTNDRHGFDQNPNYEAPIMHKVLVDGEPALAGIGSFGAYSERIVLAFDPPHEEWGQEFATKYFRIEKDNPGILTWGNDGRSFRIDIIIE